MSGDGDGGGAARMAKRLGVLGWPVAHSRSPAMQNAALAAVGLTDWRYQLLPVAPEVFEPTVRALGGAGFVGANVTIPHKEAALALADGASAAARGIGAANTLTFAPDGSIAAENTDAPGLIAAMERSPEGLSVVVLGAGGGARAVVWALREAGAREIFVWNRTHERARALAEELGATAVRRAPVADVLVNCTSVGLEVASVSAPGDSGATAADPRAYGTAPPANTKNTPETKPQDEVESSGHMGDAVVLSATEAGTDLNQLPGILDQVGEYSYVVDLVYRAGPTPLTPLLSRARERGVDTLDGLEILLAQGALSFELWTGRKAPREVMRAALRADVD
jgi:shikimate dehydrogenase